MSAIRKFVCLVTAVLLIGVGSVAQASPLLYAVTDTGAAGTLRAIDLNSNTTTVVGTLDISHLGAIAFDGGGTLYASRWLSSGFPPTQYRDLRTLDTTTALSTVVANLPTTDRYDALAFQPVTGTLFSEGMSTGHLLTINPTTGAVTDIGPISLGNFWTVSGLAFDAGGVLYGVNDTNPGGPFGSPNYRLVTFNLTTGAGTVIGTTLGMSGRTIGDIAFDPESHVLYGVDNGNGNIFPIDTTTGLAGAAVYAGAAQYGTGLAFVPEPSSAVLMMVLVAAAGALRRR